MDVDLSSVAPSFGLEKLYPLFDKKPLLGRLRDDGMRVFLNYSDSHTPDFAFEVCRYWLDEYNVDGFRFLNARSFWDGADGSGLARLARRIRETAWEEDREVYLFVDNCSTLDHEVLNRSAVNGVANHSFMRTVHRITDNRQLDQDFWKTMDLNQLNYSEESVHDQGIIPKTATNSIEDGSAHSLTVKMGVMSGSRDLLGNPVGDRKNHWWKVKPCIISQFVSPGIPLIYNGQEFGENRFVPDSGPSRLRPRPIRWQYLSDFAGGDLFRFHQKLIQLRKSFPSVRSRNFFHFFTDPQHQVTAFKRYLDEEQLIIAVNFSNESVEVLMPFPCDGYWTEYLDDYKIEVLGRKAQVKVPARYGVIFFRDS